MSETWTRTKEINNIVLDCIVPNPGNPRKNFDQAELELLAQSILDVGVLQPIVVVVNSDPDSLYRLVAGERRWRAAKLAGLKTIPAIVKKLTPKQEAEIMLVENLQRKDLDPIEEAHAYQTLLDEYDYTQEGLGEKLGVSQSQIANRLRLLELPDEIQDNISHEIISASHGRVLAGYKNLPAPVLKKAVEAIIEKRVPVAKTDDAIACVIGDIGKPLFDDYGSSKPEFKTDQCEECESNIMGRRYSHDETEYPYCVKPSCWEKKQQEVRQAREQALVDRAQKEAKKGGGVVDLKKFTWNQYEEFQDYKTKGLDLSECQNCEHKKVAKSYGDKLTEVCFQPSCFKKKQAAATREKNKQAKNAFQVELERIAILAKNTASDCRLVIIPRPVLIYLAAQVLANVTNHYERGKTRYQWVKEKFGWDDNCFKSTAYHSLGADWVVFRVRLESLTEQQLWQIIFEWPAVAEGLTGIRSWMLEEGLLSSDELQPDNDPDPDGHSVCRVCGCTDDMACPGGCYWVEPDLCSRCAEGLEAEEMPLEEFLALVDEDDQGRFSTAYIYNGKQIFISRGLWDGQRLHDGENIDTRIIQYGTFYESASGGLHRVKSPAMPMVPTAEEAQANLDAWAAKKGLKAVTERSESA